MKLCKIKNRSDGSNLTDFVVLHNNREYEGIIKDGTIQKLCCNVNRNNSGKGKTLFKRYMGTKSAIGSRIAAFLKEERDRA